MTNEKMQFVILLRMEGLVVQQQNFHGDSGASTKKDVGICGVRGGGNDGDKLTEKEETAQNEASVGIILSTGCPRLYYKAIDFESFFFF